VPGLQVVFNNLYNDEEQQEYQTEELLTSKWLQTRNVTVHGAFDMEETVCLPGNKMPRRKSFFPSSSRKSMMPHRVSFVQEENEEEATVVVRESSLSPPPVISKSPGPSEQKAEPEIKMFKDSIEYFDNHFAVPAPPVRKIEIYQDSEEPQPITNNKSLNVEPLFDVNETCSTQIFNMFIESQAVSTPMGTQKQAPSRHFGTILRELAPPEDTVSAPAVESPVELRKQLSTILETSEHATQSLATSGTEMFATNISMIKNSTLLVPPVVLNPSAGAREVSDLSIYYKTTPLTPKQSHHSWSQSDLETSPREQYVHPKSIADLSVLNDTLADANRNPFNVELISSLLESIDFTMYIEKLPHCQLVGHVKRLHPNTQLEVQNEKFEVSKLIGKGAYGSVYAGRNVESGRKVAFKQERPTNYWEFYICLEIHSRLTSEQMVRFKW